MTAQHQGDRTNLRHPAHAPADLVASTREPTLPALPYRQIESKSIVYLTVYLGIS